MIFPRDVKTGAELTNEAITENGFMLDLAKSRYLNIDIKKEILLEGSNGLVEDVRFNKPAQDGNQYTDEGIYTITVTNRYTGQQTTKMIYVGTNDILKAYVVTGLSLQDIQNRVAAGAVIAEDGTLIVPNSAPIGSESSAPEQPENTFQDDVDTEPTNTSDAQNDIDTTRDADIAVPIIAAGVALVLLLTILVFVSRRKKQTLPEEEGEKR